MKTEKRLHLFFYLFLYFLLTCSVILFASGINNPRIWFIYHNFYIAILITYTWYIAVLLMLGDIRKDKFKRYYNEKMAVIMPVFNEEPYLFEQALKSIHLAKGNKDIFVINDGSTKGVTTAQFKTLCKKYDAQLYSFNQNRGKRHALHHAITKMIEDHKYIVTVDSDTVLDKYALLRVVEPLKDERTGASTGDVLLLNEKENILTRMVGSYYWIGINIFKKAQSKLGIVNCCSGCLAAYRSDIAMDVVDDFVNQKFLGQNCTHSEDRHLTNLVLKKGYKVKFNPEAISYTHTPSTLVGFVKQQQRWKRGFIRESTYTLSYAWRNNLVLFFQLLFCELTMPLLALGIVLTGLVITIFNPSTFFTTILPSWILCMFVRYIYLLRGGVKKIPGIFVYMFLYEIILYWQFIYAVFTVENKSWITRN